MLQSPRNFIASTTLHCCILCMYRQHSFCVVAVRQGGCRVTHTPDQRPSKPLQGHYSCNLGCTFSVRGATRHGVCNVCRLTCTRTAPLPLLRPCPLSWATGCSVCACSCQEHHQVRAVGAAAHTHGSAASPASASSGWLFCWCCPSSQACCLSFVVSATCLVAQLS